MGGLSVSREGAPLGGSAAQPRRLAVLALIARAGDRGVKREKLLTLLWPDSDEESGRAALSQALHVLRRDLGSDELFLGVQDLRLNLSLATCDVLEFEAAIGDGDPARAASAYAGPFLEGFRVPGARELDRWIEEERAPLAQRYAETLERLGKAELERGNAAAAVGWWRRRAGLDPLNARVTVELMKALDAAGERPAAIQQARIYEALLKQELAIEPDGAVVKLAAELREKPQQVAPIVIPSVSEESRSDPKSAPMPAGTASAGARFLAGARNRLPVRPGGLKARPYIRMVAAVVLVAAALFLALRPTAPPPTSPMLAIGTIRDYRSAAADKADPVTDMLATNLARVPGLQVVSTLRMLELIDRQKDRTQGDAAVAEAARSAGATELMEGGVHEIEGGRIVLELRRVDVATGAVRRAYRVEAADVFALVNKATQEIAGSVGRNSGELDPADVSTSSLAAYRFYERGLREFVRGDLETARGLFDAALEEDSSFVMAAYYRFSVGNGTGRRWPPEKLAWLRSVADRAPDRERLLIRGYMAIALQEPGLVAFAETLAVRYPRELDGHFLLGYARMTQGEFAQAIPNLDRVLVLDSTGLGAGSARCLTCDAVSLLTYAWHAVDSVPEALRLARQWAASDSNSLRAWNDVARLAVVVGKDDEALAAWSRVTPMGTPYEDIFPGVIHLVRGRFADAERAFRTGVTSPSPDKKFESLWHLAIFLRHAGRWEESVRLMRQRAASYSAEERAKDLDYLPRTAEALALYESGRFAESMRTWDSIAVHPNPVVSEGDLNRRQAFLYALLADAAFSAGDSTRLSRYVDSASAWAGRSNNPRDNRIADHARGVQLLARGDTVQAIAALRRAIFSPTIGFTRTNLVLGRVLTANGRAAEAVALLQQALRGGSVESTNLYVTHTALHEQLGYAFQALKQRDSAKAHLGYVAAAFEKSDPVARERLAAARSGTQ